MNAILETLSSLKFPHPIGHQVLWVLPSTPCPLISSSSWGMICMKYLFNTCLKPSIYIISSKKPFSNCSNRINLFYFFPCQQPAFTTFIMLSCNYLLICLSLLLDFEQIKDRIYFLSLYFYLAYYVGDFQWMIKWYRKIKTEIMGTRKNKQVVGEGKPIF